MREDFAIFILTHGRPFKVLTTDALKKANNTNKIYYVVDNEDSSISSYQYKFGKESVIIFDKKKKSEEFDTMDLSEDRRAIVYARNACFDIARDLGIRYFLELDDDYTIFRSRIWDGKKLGTWYLKDFDAVVDEMIEFLNVSGAKTVAFSQTGDYIGGTGSKIYQERLTRKAMNSFFCDVTKPFDFVGRINEDVNTYVSLGNRGELLFTVADISLNQLGTQQNKGGMSELYLDSGTYVKSFYSVIINPAAVKIYEMGDTHRRIHHHVDWEVCVPKIISSRYKK